MGVVTADKIKDRIRSHLKHDEARDLMEIEFASEGELMAYLFKITDNESFISEAYRAVLGRMPDPEGLDLYLARLNRWWPKAMILGSIAGSEEARLDGRGFQLSTVTIYRFLASEKLKASPLTQGLAGRVYEAPDGRRRAGKRPLISSVPIISPMLLWIYSLIMMPLNVRALLKEERYARGRRLSEHNDRSMAGLGDRSRRLEDLIRDSRVISADNKVILKVEGFIMALPGEDLKMASYLAFYGKLEQGLVKAFKRSVKERMVVVDVGANIGIYTLIGASLVGRAGRVHSFEPTPRTFSLLKNNIEINSFSDRVTAYKMAAFDKKSTLDFSTYESDPSRNTLFPEPGDSGLVKVDTISLDEALAAEPRIDVVKVDAEGSEAFIIKGMAGIIQKNPQLVIFMEMAPKHLRLAGIAIPDFIAELRAYGLSMRKVDDMTGEYLPVSQEELMDCFSMNLVLTRGGR